VHRLLQGEEADLAGIVAQHPREGAPDARVRMTADGDAIGADHGVGIAENASHVGFVHDEEDAQRRDQALDRRVQVAAPLGGNRGEVTPGRLRIGL